LYELSLACDIGVCSVEELEDALLLPAQVQIGQQRPVNGNARAQQR
jgi:hypothetical protein